MTYMLNHLLTGEAQKKLDEMEDQRTTLDTDVNEVKDKCASKQKEIDEMKEQISQQERGERVYANSTSAKIKMDSLYRSFLLIATS